MDEPTLEQVRQKLSDIYEEMLALPVDDYEQRSALKNRQNELRQTSRQLIAGQPLHDAAVLKAAYERLEQVRDRLLHQHLTHTSTSVGDAGIESTFTNAVNKAIDAGHGLEEVEARLKEILDQMRSTG
ncbi:MAG: hypothetical protein ACRDU9_08720 [Acidimicrobiia bacterium]